MTEHQMPFDHQPDTELGDALRRALEPAAHDAFVARVMARVGTTRAGSWDVLASWAGRGIAAALLVLGVGFAAGRMMQSTVGTASIEEALVMGPADSGGAAIAVVRGSRPPDASVVFSSQRP
ncbi:MAG TPA: hypothetical protein VMC86_07450 [Gemmatimonadales bacterium]|nr:hypothetical protein [Gemmatimonadales bacterium]